MQGTFSSISGFPRASSSRESCNSGIHIHCVFQPYFHHAICVCATKRKHDRSCQSLVIKTYISLKQKMTEDEEHREPLSGLIFWWKVTEEIRKVTVRKCFWLSVCSTQWNKNTGIKSPSGFILSSPVRSRSTYSSDFFCFRLPVFCLLILFVFLTCVYHWRS